MAAKDNVSVRMSAEDAGLFDAWRKAAKGPEEMEKAIERATKSGKKNSDELGGSLANMAGEWLKILGGIEAARRALEAYFKVLEEHQKSKEDSTRTIDQGMATYAQVQHLKTPQQLKTSATRIGNQAAKAGASANEAIKAATMLGRFQFSDEEATGDALAELLNFQDATSTSGENVEDFSRQTLEILKRSGANRDAKSIRRLGAFVTHLTGRAAGFGAEMLGEYSGVADAATRAGMSEEEGLALYAALREKEDKPKTAKSTFIDWLKPGMQKGEQAMRGRAAQLMGGDSGLAEYETAGKIADETLGQREQSAEVAKQFSDYQPGILSSKLAHDRLINALRAEAGGRARPVVEAIESKRLGVYEWFNNFDTEAAVKDAYGEDGLMSNATRDKYALRRERILGNESIPNSSPVRVQVDVKVHGASNLDIPSTVSAKQLGDN